MCASESVGLSVSGVRECGRHVHQKKTEGGDKCGSRVHKTAPKADLLRPHT